MKLKKNIAVSESGFMFDPTSGDSYSLNPIGVDIVTYLQKGLSADEITRELQKEYDADKSVIERNLYDFVGMLKQYNLLLDEEN